MMQWEKLLSAKRWGSEDKYNSDPTEARSEFQRDYDRLIFSSPFRRLQNKTQVFPLPGSIFVHNRLTHSLEVASVGKSLGRMFYNHLKTLNHQIDDELPLISEIANIQTEGGVSAKPPRRKAIGISFDGDPPQGGRRDIKVPDGVLFQALPSYPPDFFRLIRHMRCRHRRWPDPREPKAARWLQR